MHSKKGEKTHRGRIKKKSKKICNLWLICPSTYPILAENDCSGEKGVVFALFERFIPIPVHLAAIPDHKRRGHLLPVQLGCDVRLRVLARGGPAAAGVVCAPPAAGLDLQVFRLDVVGADGQDHGLAVFVSQRNDDDVQVAVTMERSNKLNANNLSTNISRVCGSRLMQYKTAVGSLMEL